MTPNTAAVSAGTAAGSGPTGIRIKAGALANAATGQILWSEGLDTERPIGSIVKVMTAGAYFGRKPNQVITVPKSVIGYLKKQDQPSTAGLIPGDKLTATLKEGAVYLNHAGLPSAARGYDGARRHLAGD